MPGGEDGAVAGEERRAGGDGQLTETVPARLLGRGLHLQEQRLQLGGPGLLILLLEKGQFAQVVDVTERMAAAHVALIRLPAVVHAHPAIGRQDAHGVSRRAATLGMDRA
jgi:hypothetical protein